MKYKIREECGGIEEINARSKDAALRKLEAWVRDGDYGDRSKTVWVSASITPIRRGAEVVGESERVTITIEADAPDCADGTPACHEWESPIEVVGGCHENPGVYGHGGGIICKEICRVCGTYRVTDSWAQNPSTGEQGLTSIEYRAADASSKKWIEALLAEAAGTRGNDRR